MILGAVQLDLPTLIALLIGAVTSSVSLVRWRSGERGNVIAQTATELSTAADAIVKNLMADNLRLRKENASLLGKLAEFETRIMELTKQISQLRVELTNTRREHTPTD